MESVAVSWDEIDRALKKLIKNMLDRYIFGFEERDVKIVYALGRGGFVPARLVSGQIGVKKVGFIDPNKRFRVLRKAVICDDILDTGATYLKVSKKTEHPFDSPYFCFLFARKGNAYLDNQDVFYGTLVRSSKYLVFPWERGLRD